jgi:hypothetical protein
MVKSDPVHQLQVLALQKLSPDDLEFLEQNAPFGSQANRAVDIPESMMTRVNAALVAAAAELKIALPFCAEEMRL